MRELRPASPARPGSFLPSDPLLSIVTASYNAAATIAETIGSIAAQKGEDIEYLVIDGGSTDGTRDIAARFPSVIDCLVSEPDAGIYDAWNKGVARARGEYVAFLGADDIYLPDALDRYRRFVGANPDLDFVSSRIRYGPGPTARVVGRPFRWSEFRRYMTIAHPGALHRRAWLLKLGCFDTSFRIAGDYDLMLRAGPTLRAGYLDALTVEMGRGGVSSVQLDTVFSETVRTKVANGATGRITAEVDRLVAKAKSRVRKWL